MKGRFTNSVGNGQGTIGVANRSTIPLHISFISIASNVKQWVRRQEEEVPMQEELEMFIKYAASSLSKLHLLLFFHRNPNLPDTVDGITKKTGLKKEETKEALMDLLLSDIVSRYSRRGEIFWFYNPSQDKEALVEEIISLQYSPG
jgi:hypothetical protein